MPDLQTEMQKILQDWETPETTETTETTEEPMFTPTTNTSRATFGLVRDNPGLPKKEYIRKLEAMGHKSASTSSLLSQMVRQGQLWVGTSGGLHPNATEYTPLKPAKTFAKQQGIKIVPRKPKTSKLRTSKPEVAPVPLEEIKQAIIGKPLRSKVDTILDEISLSDAHALYRHLHQYFGNYPK